jgi:hypothetical protein
MICGTHPSSFFLHQEFISVDSTNGLATASKNKECRTPVYEKYLIDGDLCRTGLYEEAVNPNGCLWVGIDIGDKETAIVGVFVKWIPRQEKFVITQVLEKKVKNKAKIREMKIDALVRAKSGWPRYAFINFHVFLD